MSEFEKQMAAAQATNDREVAAAADWIGRSDPRLVMRLWLLINEGDGASLRSLTDVELRIVRSMSLIGFYDAFRSACDRGIL